MNRESRAERSSLYLRLTNLMSMPPEAKRYHRKINRIGRNLDRLKARKGNRYRMWLRVLQRLQTRRAELTNSQINLRRRRPSRCHSTPSNQPAHH